LIAIDHILYRSSGRFGIYEVSLNSHPTSDPVLQFVHDSCRGELLTVFGCRTEIYIDDRHGGAEPGEPQGTSAPDSTCASGNDGHVAR
jgi:hypothetical protein